MRLIGSLPGMPIDLTEFPKLKSTDILVADDFPLLILAEGPPDIPETTRRRTKKLADFPASKWLVNWCDFVEKEDGTVDPPEKTGGPLSVYEAIQITNDRLTQFLDSHISLREVILHFESDLYLYVSSDPMHPRTVTRVTPRMLPPGCLPKKDFALNGSEVFSLDDAKISAPMKIGFHIIAFKEESESWAALGPFEWFFQRYIGWAARFIKAGRELALPSIPENDWTNLRPRIDAKGSYKTFCTANTQDLTDSAHIVAACERLKEITEGGTAEVESAQGISGVVGRRAADELKSLLAIVSQQRLAVSVRWSIGDSSGELALNKQVADGTSLRMKKGRKEHTERVSLTITLTDEELAVLKRPVNGEGGWQNSLRRIQAKFEGNRITLSADEVDQILRQTQSYGPGGFQNRLYMLIQAIKRWESTLSRIR
jgi:hypothetical protein